MRKILVIGDNMFTKEGFLSPAFAERFKRFEKYGASYDAAGDTTYKRVDSNKPQEWVLKIEKEGPEWVEPDAEVLEKVKDAEVLIVHFAGVNKKILDAAKNLKLICAMRSGLENINVQVATEKGITVSNAPGRVSEPVADFTVALILVEARNIIRESLNFTKGEWKQINPKDSVNTALRNHTAGLIGLGIIGHKVAARLKPFGVRVLAYDPFCSKESASEAGVELVSLEELLKQSDYVSMHARLSEETKNLMGEKEFKLMKPTAVFINTARAGLVDEQALVNALKNKVIRSAAIDVYSQEPIPSDHPLLKLDNVTLTPHHAGATSDNMSNSLDIVLEEVERYFAGQPLKNKMN
jgi:D-3-phosphoglycerate dehydrogenase